MAKTRDYGQRAEEFTRGAKSGGPHPYGNSRPGDGTVQRTVDRQIPGERQIAPGATIPGGPSTRSIARNDAFPHSGIDGVKHVRTSKANRDAFGEKR